MSGAHQNHGPNPLCSPSSSRLPSSPRLPSSLQTWKHPICFYSSHHPRDDREIPEIVPPQRSQNSRDRGIPEIVIRTSLIVGISIVVRGPRSTPESFAAIISHHLPVFLSISKAVLVILPVTTPSHHRQSLVSTFPRVPTRTAPRCVRRNPDSEK